MAKIPPTNTMPKGFETVAEALARRASKIHLLSDGNSYQRRLAATLQRCRQGHRCQSGACDVCLRLYRLRLYFQSQAIFPQRQYWTRASVVPTGFRFPVGQLAVVDLKALAGRIDKRIERSSLCGRLVFAGIDISLNLQDNQILGWQFHLYLLIEGQNTLQLGTSCTMSPPGSARDGSGIARTWLTGLGKRRRPLLGSCAARILANFWCVLRTPLHDSLVKTKRTAEYLIWAVSHCSRFREGWPVAIESSLIAK
jgi:hypothetical protein